MSFCLLYSFNFSFGLVIDYWSYISDIMFRAIIAPRKCDSLFKMYIYIMFTFTTTFSLQVHFISSGDQFMIKDTCKMT